MAKRVTEGRPGVLSPLSIVNLVVLCVLALIAVLLVVTHHLTSVVILLAVVALITYLLLGPVHFIEILVLKSPLARMNLRLPWSPAPLTMTPGLRRSLAIVTVYLLGLLLVAAVLFRMIPLLLGQLSGLAHELPTYIAKAEAMPGASVPVEKEPESLSELLSGAITATAPEAGQASAVPAPPTEKKMPRVTSGLLVKKSVQLLQEYAARIGTALLNVGATALTGLVYFLTALVMVFYLLHDGRLLKERFVAILPESAEREASRYLEHLHGQIFTYLKGQVMVNFLWGGMMYLLLLLLEVKYSLLLALFFGFSAIIPVIGPWFGMLPIALVTLLGDSPLPFGQVLLFNGVFYMVKTYWLWPRLIPRKYDLHPVLFILTFMVCLQVVGYLGILLSFPVTGLLGGTYAYLQGRSFPDSEDVLAHDDAVGGAGA